MRKAYTLIELLAVIAILAIITAIAYPKIIDVIGSSKIKAYDVSKKNIIESAKLKYVADANNAVVTEYLVADLIKDGYISKDAKNPLTNEEYKNERVIITNDNGEITLEYVDGDTLYNLISNKGSEDGLYKNDNTYIYQGNEAKNYISFNGEIYRILKIDSYRNVYLLKDENDRVLKKEEIDNYVSCYYNDSYSEELKNMINDVMILDYQMYLDSYNGDDTFIINNNNIWVNNKDYKVLDLSDNISELTSANVRLVIKLNNNVTILSGDGTQLSPYVVGY